MKVQKKIQFDKWAVAVETNIHFMKYLNEIPKLLFHTIEEQKVYITAESST